MKNLAELMQKRDSLCFLMIEADGDEFYELQKELEDVENEIYLATDLIEKTEVRDDEA